MSKEEGEQVRKEDVEEEDPDDPVITLQEYVDEEDKMREMAEAVLGPSEDTTCTYSKGYVKRQALYSCLTCHPLEVKGDTEGKEGVREDKVRSGICLPCAESCHSDHDLVELYTKRNFRCDCGNTLFPGLSCKLIQDKDNINTDNVYNQNFDGHYCYCHCPYPDPDPADDVAEDEMVQCVICEDWYHTKHLNGVDGKGVVMGDAVDSVTCSSCIEKYPFLQRYAHSHTNSGTNNSDDCKESNGDKDGDECKLEKLPGRDGEATAILWSRGWRDELCSCDKCKMLYNSAGVGYLMDKEDCLDVYEGRGGDVSEVGGGRKRSAAGGDGLMDFLSGCDRFVQMEMIHGYNDLKEKLAAFMMEKQAQGKVLKPDDVTQFFEDLKSKRQRLGSGYQFSCK